MKEKLQRLMTQVNNVLKEMEDCYKRMHNEELVYEERQSAANSFNELGYSLLRLLGNCDQTVAQIIEEKKKALGGDDTEDVLDGSPLRKRPKIEEKQAVAAVFGQESETEERSLPRTRSESSLSSNILPENTQVAAVDVNGVEKNWIWAKVKRYLPKQKRYELLDMEEVKFETKQRSFLAPPNMVVPLRQENEVCPAGTKVLALFPATTVFYSAKVISEPLAKRVKQRRGGHYLLEFVDDEKDEKGNIMRREIEAKFVFKDPTIKA